MSKTQHSGMLDVARTSVAKTGVADNWVQQGDRKASDMKSTSCGRCKVNLTWTTQSQSNNCDAVAGCDVAEVQCGEGLDDVGMGAM